MGSCCCRLTTGLGKAGAPQQPLPAMHQRAMAMQLRLAILQVACQVHQVPVRYQAMTWHGVARQQQAR